VRLQLDFRRLMLGSALSAVPVSLVLLAFPDAMVSLFGPSLDPVGRLAVRLWAVELLGAGLLCWLVRDLGPGRSRGGILLGFLVADLVGAAVLTQAQLAGVMNALGWALVAAYLALAAVYGHVWWWSERPST
jgi:hypothetical protein